MCLEVQIGFLNSEYGDFLMLLRVLYIMFVSSDVSKLLTSILAWEDCDFAPRNECDQL